MQRKYKFFDTELSERLATGENRFTALLVPTTNGTGESQFVGRGITVVMIQSRVRIKLPSTMDNDDTSDLVRLDLVLDTQNNQNTINGSYLNDGGSTAVSGAWMGFQEPTQMDRFQILWTEDHKLNIPSGGPGASMSGEDNAFSVVDLPCYIPISYLDLGGGTFRPRGNAPYLIATTAHGHANWSAGTRVWYKDE